MTRLAPCGTDSARQRHRRAGKACAECNYTPKPPAPAVDRSWQDRAACKGLDAEAFFPEVGSAVDPLVRRVCAACPVRAACLEYGLRDPHGVYGGLSPNERKRLRRQRREVA